ncbi:MAG: hypothetical protein Q9184_002656 [Pyrenodesmia sp. 2 TL-2023]
METEHKAVVTLTPRNEKGDFKRIITLESPNKPVVIGRASKTASKGLVGLPENAWFNSPIMSREHGKIFMTPTRAVHIEDCASTHGTFIKTRRLEPKRSYALSDGDIVTFGSTITSGPVTYHGRSFDVEISSVNITEKINCLTAFRSTQISPSSTASKASERSGFHVPNDDVESISDVSEAESCLIVKANPRTFSVPSSGDEGEETDDDVIISTSRRAFLAKKAPSPEIQQTSKQPETPFLETTHPEQPTGTQSQAESQQDSKGLKEGSHISDSLLDDNSVDGELDSIPPGQALQVAPTDRGVIAESMSITEIPETYQPAPPEVADMQTHRSSDGNEDRHEDGSYAVSPQESEPTSPADEYASESRFSGSPSIQEYASGDDSDEDDHHSTGQATGSGSPASVFSGIQLDSAQDPITSEIQFENAQDHSLAPQVPSGCSSGSFGLFRSGAIQEAVQSSPYLESPDLQSTNFQSPNIQSQNVQSLRRGTAEYGFPQHPHRTPTVYNPSGPFGEAWNQLKTRARAPSPSDAALFRNAASSAAQSDSPLIAAAQHGEIPGSDCYNGQIDHLRLLSGSSYGNSSVSPASIFGHAPVMPPPTRFRSTFPPYSGQVSHDWQAGPANELKASRIKPGEYQQGPFSRLHGPSLSAADSSSAARPPPLMSPPPQKHCLVKLKYDTESGKEIHSNKEFRYHNLTGKEDCTSHSYLKLDSTKSNKVDISNLVNTNAERSRSLKRKSDQISSEEPASSVVGVTSQPLPKSSTNQSQDKTDVPKSNAAPALTAASLAQDLTLVSAQPAPDTAVEEPARKRVKMSSSKAGTIGGLVSGLCLGVAGAVAAFIAAIPADVRDEALRETVKLR